MNIPTLSPNHILGPRNPYPGAGSAHHNGPGVPDDITQAPYSNLPPSGREPAASSAHNEGALIAAGGFHGYLRREYGTYRSGNVTFSEPAGCSPQSPASKTPEPQKLALILGAGFLLIGHLRRTGI